MTPPTLPALGGGSPDFMALEAPMAAAATAPRTYGYQLGYVESTRFAVLHFRPSEPVADVETAIEMLIGELLLPLLPDADPDTVVSALFHLSRGGHDSDRTWDDDVPFDASEFRVAADELGWVIGHLFADEVMQGANVWITRGWGCVYTRESGADGRKPRGFVMPVGAA